MQVALKTCMGPGLRAPCAATALTVCRRFPGEAVSDSKLQTRREAFTVCPSTFVIGNQKGLHAARLLISAPGVFAEGQRLTDSLKVRPHAIPALPCEAEVLVQQAGEASRRHIVYRH